MDAHKRHPDRRIVREADAQPRHTTVAEGVKRIRRSYLNKWIDMSCLPLFVGETCLSGYVDELGFLEPAGQELSQQPFDEGGGERLAIMCGLVLLVLQITDRDGVRV